MRDFMDYVHSAFYEATGWTRDNSYAALNATPDGMSMLSTAPCVAPYGIQSLTEYHD